MTTEPTSGERRTQSRTRQRTEPIQLQYATSTGKYESVAVEVFDSGEGGVGIVCQANLNLHAEVLLIGNWGDGEKRQRATVRWCRPTQSGRFRIGLLFLANATDNRKSKNQETSNQKAANPKDDGPSKKESVNLQSVEDYYELMQLHAKADPETIHRIYRLMAQRYHPDNKDSGNTTIFREITEAYKVLSDPEQRAAYDIKTQIHRSRRWRIFDQQSATKGVGDEKRKRAGLLGLLYTKRLKDPEAAVMSIQELEDLLGVPREHLEFSLWYLKEQGQITRTDAGKFSITIKGVDAAEDCQASWQPTSAKLLPAPDLVEVA